MKNRLVSHISLKSVIGILIFFIVISFFSLNLPNYLIYPLLVLFIIFFILRVYSRWSYIKKGQGIIDKYLIDIVLFIIFAFVFTNRILAPALIPHLSVIPSCSESDISAFKFRLDNKADFADDNFNLIIKDVATSGIVKELKSEYQKIFDKLPNKTIIVNGSEIWYYDKLKESKSSQTIIFLNESEAFYDKNSTILSGKAKDFCSLVSDNRERQIKINCKPIPPKSYFEIHFNVNRPINSFNIEYYGEITPLKQEKIICKKAKCKGYITDRFLNLWYFLINKEEDIWCYPVLGGYISGQQEWYGVWMGESPFYVHGEMNQKLKNIYRIGIILFLLVSLYLIILLFKDRQRIMQKIKEMTSKK